MQTEKRNKLTLMWKIWHSMVWGGFSLGLIYALAAYLTNPAGKRWYNEYFVLLPLSGFLVGFGYYIFVKAFTRFLTQKLIGKSESLLKQKISVVPHVFKSSEIDEMESTTALMIENLKIYKENLLRVGKEEEKVRNTFGYYISPQIVDKIVSAGGSIATSGENMDITIMFVDIKGFGELIQSEQNSAIFEFINGYFSEMGVIIENKEGFIDKYVDQEIVILFGAPIKHIDDEIRATETAVTMRAAFHEKQKLWMDRFKFARRLDLAIGINKGNVVVGNIGSQHKLNYTAIGDNVNFAARLCTSAAPGEILVSESVYSVVSKNVTSYNFTKKEPISVKGKEGLFNVYTI